jgi:hypothetical protein
MSTSVAAVNNILLISTNELKGENHNNTVVAFYKNTYKSLTPLFVVLILNYPLQTSYKQHFVFNILIKKIKKPIYPNFQLLTNKFR